MERKHKKWIGYACYGLLLTMVLLYYRFPSKAVKDYLEARLARENPPLGLSIEEVSPSFTFGLNFVGTKLYRKAKGDRILFRADRLIIRPVPWSFFSGGYKFCFDGLAYGGSLKGCVQFSNKGRRAPLTASIRVKDLNAGKYDGLSDLIGRRVKGILDGSFMYSGQYPSLLDGTGEADVRLSHGLVELLQPILTLESIDFDELSVKMHLKDKKIDLTQVELKGPTMQGTLSGTVTLNREFVKSGLNLRGTIEPFADFFKTGASDMTGLFKQGLRKGKISFVIQGTITDPRFRFI